MRDPQQLNHCSGGTQLGLHIKAQTCSQRKGVKASRSPARAVESLRLSSKIGGGPGVPP